MALPVGGSFKINIDVVQLRDTQRTGGGMVVWDDNEEFVVAHSLCFLGVV